LEPVGYSVGKLVMNSWAKIVNEDVEDPYGENKSKNKKYDVPNKKDSDKKGK